MYSVLIYNQNTLWRRGSPLCRKMQGLRNHGSWSAIQSPTAASVCKRLRLRNRPHIESNESVLGIDFTVSNDAAMSKNLSERLKDVYSGHFLPKQSKSFHGCMMIVKNLQYIPGSGSTDSCKISGLHLCKVELMKAGDILVAIDGSQIVGEKAETIISKLVAPRGASLYLTFARCVLNEEPGFRIDYDRSHHRKDENILVYSLSMPRQKRVFRYEFCENFARPALGTPWTYSMHDAHDGPSWDTADPPSESALSDVCSEVSIGPRAFLKFDSLGVASPDQHTTKLVFKDNHLHVLQALSQDHGRDTPRVSKPPRAFLHRTGKRTGSERRTIRVRIRISEPDHGSLKRRRNARRRRRWRRRPQIWRRPEAARTRATQTTTCPPRRRRPFCRRGDRRRGALARVRPPGARAPAERRAWALRQRQRPPRS